MGVKSFFKKVFGVPEISRELIVSLPSEEDKKRIAQIRLQNEKIRDQSIRIRDLEKELKKYEKKKKQEAEEKIIINQVLKEAKKQRQEKLQTKAVYQLVYPKSKPFIQYSNGKRRRYEGFEINETKDGTPMFRLRFFHPELKKIIPLQLDAPELTFFFKNIIGLSTQHNTGIIPLNVDEVEGKPVFINSEIDFLKQSQIQIARLIKDMARKDNEIRKLRGEIGTKEEIQAEQEKDLADREMALRYAQKDSENKSAKLEQVMQINLATTDKLKTDHIEKSMSELKMAQSLRTLQGYEEANQLLNQRLSEAFSSDAYELGKQDTLDLLDRITKNILTVQSTTKLISTPQVKTIIKEEKKEEK